MFFLQALLLLPILAITLRLAGLARCQRMLAALCDAAPGDWTVEQAARTAYLVSVASYRGLYRANCLERSLALWFLLRRRGVAGDLRIGVSNGDRELKAHAWIEYRGFAINDAEDVGRWYAAFDRAIEPARGFPR